MIRSLSILFLIALPFLSSAQEKNVPIPTSININEKYIDSVFLEIQKLKINSEKKVVYSQIYNKYVVRSEEEAIAVFEYAKTKDTTAHHKMMVLYNLGNIFVAKGKQEEALIFLNSGKDLSKKIKDLEGEFNFHISLATTHINLNNPDVALFHLNYAEAIHLDANQKDNLWKVYLYKGILQDKIGNVKEKVIYWKKMWKAGAHLENNSHKRYILYTLADFFTYTIDIYPIEAVQFTDLWLQHYHESRQDVTRTLPTGHVDVHFRFKNDLNPDHIKSLERTLFIADSLNSPETMVYTANTLAEINQKNGKPQTAINYLQQVEKKLATLEDPHAQLTLFNLLVKNTELAGDYKLALHYKTLEGDQRDLIRSEQMVKNIAEQKVQFETEKKEKENELLAIENTLINQQKSNQLKIFIFGAFFLISIGTLLFFQNRQRKKANTKLILLNTELDLANKVKTRFFSILNHDLRSPVANLISFLNLQKENPELLDEETKKRMDEKTVHTAENLLQSMEDMLLWSKGQMEHFAPQFKKISVSNLFIDNQKVFSGYNQIEIKYINDENIEIVTDENYLKTILRNLTSNAINAITSAKNPKIVWKAWQKNSKKFISISDNGPGASKEQLQALFDENNVVGIQSGLGLHLIRDLAKPINCKIDVESQPDNGTTFILEFQGSNNKPVFS